MNSVAEKKTVLRRKYLIICNTNILKNTVQVMYRELK